MELLKDASAVVSSDENPKVEFLLVLSWFLFSWSVCGESCFPWACHDMHFLTLSLPPSLWLKHCQAVGPVNVYHSYYVDNCEITAASSFN